MPSATLSRLFAMACLGTVAACGSSDDGNLLVNLSNVPDRVTTLSVTATLDGRMATGGAQTKPATPQLGIGLPMGTTGSLVLSIQAFDADGCLRGNGQLTTTLTGKYSEQTVTINPQVPRTCGSMKGCAAGTICAYTGSPVTTTLWGLWTVSPIDIWAVGDYGIALHYDGTSWTDKSPATTNFLKSVWASGTKDVWAVGASGSILHNTGQGWSSSTNGALNDLNGVYGVGPTDIWAVGDSSSATTQGEFWHFDTTMSWKRVTTGSVGSLLSVWASSPTDITASGASGMLIRYNGSWSPVATNTTNDLRSVWGSGSNSIFAVGALGTVFRFDGTMWKRITPSGYGATLSGVGGDASTVYAVGNANGSGNSIKSAAPFDTFSVQSSGSTNDLTGVSVGTNGIGWVTGKVGYLGYFDTRP